MSKYRDKGALHFAEYDNPRSIYRKHALCVMQELVHVSDPVQTVLDVGAGEGLFCWLLANEGMDVLGFETDLEAIKLSKRRAPLVKVIERDATLPNWGNFDLVLMLDFLEHVPEDARTDVLAEAIRSAPWVFIAVPDRPDAHAVGEQPTTGWVWREMSSMRADWMFSAQRHARHVMLFHRRVSWAT